MKKTIHITRDGTRVIVRINRFTESFDTHYMDDDEVVDRVRWTIVTGNAHLEKPLIRALLREIGLVA